jgi:hypothetical protein
LLFQKCHINSVTDSTHCFCMQIVFILSYNVFF